MSEMKMELVDMYYYTIDLTEDDVKLIRKWIKDNKEKLPFFSNIRDQYCIAVKELYKEGKINLKYDKSKEPHDNSKKFDWSIFEDRSPEEILGE